MGSISPSSRSDSPPAHAEYVPPPRSANDEKAWLALHKVAMDKSRALVEELKGGLDVNLIFVRRNHNQPNSILNLALQIALFVTVITAFLAPVVQTLSENPVDRTNALLANLTELWLESNRLNNLVVPINITQPTPFIPAKSTMIVYLLLSLSLIISVRDSATQLFKC
jgi:hypothetical protein